MDERRQVKASAIWLLQKVAVCALHNSQYTTLTFADASGSNPRIPQRCLGPLKAVVQSFHARTKWLADVLRAGLPVGFWPLESSSTVGR